MLKNTKCKEKKLTHIYNEIFRHRHAVKSVLLPCTTTVDVVDIFVVNIHLLRRFKQHKQLFYENQNQGSKSRVLSCILFFMDMYHKEINNIHQGRAGQQDTNKTKVFSKIVCLVKVPRPRVQTPMTLQSIFLNINQTKKGT